MGSVMDLQEYKEKLNILTEENNYQAASKFIEELPNADIAELLSEIEPDCSRRIITLFEPKQQASIFGYLSPSMQAILSAEMSRQELASLFEIMDHDERADLYNQLSENDRWAVLPGIAHAEREDIRRLASYADETVGSIMTSAYVTLKPTQTAAQAIETIRLEAPDVETIYQGYVVDDDRILIGAVSLRDLLLSRPSSLIKDIMVSKVITSNDHDPKANAARLIGRYDLLAVPVINENNQMVGIVTHDDALDVTEQENTEDQHKLGAVSKMASSLSEATIWALYKTRVGWLVILVFGNIFSGASLAHFEDLIAAIVSLVFFLPLLIDSGGNAGSQSATLMVRALATEDVHAKDWFKLLSKELSVSLMLGLSMAAAVSILGFWRGGPEVALVVSLTMTVIVIVGSLVGMSLPFILDKLKLDPASASAPLVTTICDGLGVIIYFNVASLILISPNGI